MKQYTRAEIKEIISERGVQYVSLQFSDILGTVKSVDLPVTMLDAALDNKIMFDGSSIEGFVRIQEADMCLHPDLGTFMVFDDDDTMGDCLVARFICDVYKTNGEPFEGDPRYVLKKVLKKMQEAGYNKFNVGFEAEFYLLRTDEMGRPTLEFSDAGSYFDLAPMDGSENCRRDIVLTLERLGFEMQQSHHEVGPGQNEINFKYADALSTCDSIQTLKHVVKKVAGAYGLYATFLPKPKEGFPGNGMHTNCSLVKDNHNVFGSENDDLRISETCRKFISGIIAHSKAITALANPTINSYKRLMSGYEAPCYIAWASANRSTMIRLPAVTSSENARIEIRSVDPSCNPYLAIAAILTAGLEGISSVKEPIKPVTENLFSESPKQLKRKHIEKLPESLEVALEELSKDQSIMECLGEHVSSKFLAAKHCECDKYQKQISKWEIDYYLPKL